MASKLDQACSRAQGNVPDCVAVGYVEMGSGMLLGAKTVESHPREVLDLVAAATADMFQGTNVSSIERIFKKARGVKDDGSHYFQEVIVNSENLVHIFLRAKKFPEQAAVFVCRKSVNLGMALTKSRLVLSELETAV